MTKSQGAVPQAIIFFLGIALSLPDEINIGIMLLKAFSQSTAATVTAQNILNSGINSLNILGFALMLESILGIFLSAKNGNWI